MKAGEGTRGVAHRELQKKARTMLWLLSVFLERIIKANSGWDMRQI
jgi:hypothetical protein